jgi:hypothetical protein
LRKNFSEKWQFEHKTPQGVLGKHFTSSLVLFAAFEKRVCANKESSSYIYILYHIYIYREREREATGTIRERERERERIGKTRVVASLRVVVVEKEYIKVRNRSEIRKRYKREE